MSKFMSWCAGLAVLGVVAGCGQAPAALRASAWVAGRWGRAIEVPGLGALNKGADDVDVTGVNSVSCASAGNCALAGTYGEPYGLGFVAVERNGRWGKAIKVPGLAALNTGGEIYVSSVSCAPASACSAGGSYTDRHHHFQGFVVSQTG